MNPLAPPVRGYIRGSFGEPLIYDVDEFGRSGDYIGEQLVVDPLSYVLTVGGLQLTVFSMPLTVAATA